MLTSTSATGVAALIPAGRVHALTPRPERAVVAVLLRAHLLTPTRRSCTRGGRVAGPATWSPRSRQSGERGRQAHLLDRPEGHRRSAPPVWPRHRALLCSCGRALPDASPLSAAGVSITSRSGCWLARLSEVGTVAGEGGGQQEQHLRRVAPLGGRGRSRRRARPRRPKSRGTKFLICRKSPCNLALQRLRVTLRGPNAGRPAVPRPYTRLGVAASRLQCATWTYVSSDIELVQVR